MDLEDNQRNSTENCFIPDTDDQVHSLTIARATTGAVCFLANALTLLAIIFYQAWRTTLQQILLYLSVASLLFSLSYLIPAHKSPTCIAAGFLEEWFGLSVVTFAYVASAALLVEQIKILLKSRRDLNQNVKSAPRNKILLVFIIFLGFICPALLPAGQFSYPSVWCWTTHSNHTYYKSTSPAIIFSISLELIFGGVLFVIISGLLLSFLCWVCVSKPPGSKAVVTVIVKGLVLWLFATLLTVVIVIQVLAVISCRHVYKFRTNHVYKLRMTYTVLKPVILLPLTPAVWIYYRGKDLDYKQAKKQWAHCFKKKQHAFQPDLTEGEELEKLIDPSSEGTLSYRPLMTSDSLFQVDDRSGSGENTPLIPTI